MRSVAISARENLEQSLAAPRCAQCQTIMTLERVEPHPHDPARDRHSFVCRTCGLPDRIDCLRMGR